MGPSLSDTIGSDPPIHDENAQWKDVWIHGEKNEDDDFHLIAFFPQKAKLGVMPFLSWGKRGC